MRNDFSRAPGPAATSSIALQCVWDVAADAGYDVSRRNDDRVLLAVRTRGGTGRLAIGRRGTVEVPADSLLVTEGHRLSRYWCAGEEWVFCWYEFQVTGPLHFPLDTVMRVPPLPDEETRRDTIFAALRRDRFAERCRASAEFAALLYAWAVGWRGTTRTSPHAAAIAKAIDRMHETLEAPIGIAELAAGASMSERLFRDEFRIATGQAPKRFYEQLRLGLAHELLQLGIYTVSQVAARLGYSSPFHFSRTFKQRYGVAPSVIREQSG